MNRHTETRSVIGKTWGQKSRFFFTLTLSWMECENDSSNLLNYIDFRDLITSWMMYQPLKIYFI